MRQFLLMMILGCVLLGFPHRLPRPVQAGIALNPAGQIRTVTYRAVSRGCVNSFECGYVEFYKNGSLFYRRTGGGGGGRGFTVVAINPLDGELLHPVMNFDTWFTRTTGSAASALVTFLRSLPPGTLVLIAVGDEAGLNLDNSCSRFPFSWVSSVLNELTGLGSQQVLNYCFRNSWALAVYKGQGQAREALNNGVDVSVQESVTITPPCPTVTGISPTGGLVETPITIRGLNLSAVQSVKFSGNAAANFTISADGQTINTVVPKTALSGPITLSQIDCPDTLTESFTVEEPEPVELGASLVEIRGRQLFLRRRNLDGALAPEIVFPIIGINYSPASRTTNTSPFDPNNAEIRRREFKIWATTDLPLLKQMKINTVRLFIDPGLDEDGLALLDQFYAQQIMVVMTIDDAINNLVRVEQAVNRYKNHPAILMWSLGSEWNINRYFGVANSVQEAAERTQTAAALVKQLDSQHPVASSYGEIAIAADGLRLADTQRYVNTVCTSVDVWGLNIYRGNRFGDLFTQWAALSSKPMFIGEYGTDAFRSTTTTNPPQGAIDEAMQAQWNLSLWKDILDHLSADNPGQVCLGGMAFIFSDEWWKVSPPTSQEPNGFFLLNGHPDHFANEEYFGAVTIDRQPRQLYFALCAAFDPTSPFLVSATFDGRKKITLSGYRFAANAKVFINDTDQTARVSSASDTAIILKGKQKKLGLVAGDNTVQVMNANGKATNSITIRLP